MSSVTPIPDIDASDMRARLIDVAERRQLCAIRFIRDGILACIVGVVVVVDARAIRLSYGGRNSGEVYTLQISSLRSVVELTEPPAKAKAP